MPILVSGKGYCDTYPSSVALGLKLSAWQLFWLTCILVTPIVGMKGAGTLLVGGAADCRG
jgi:hypothetical protein